MQNEIKGYKLEKQIGKGISSVVFLGSRIKDGEKVAIKMIDKSFLADNRYKKYVNNEIFILKNIKNENIIRFYEVVLDVNYIYLIFEFCNGLDLDKCLKKYKEKYDKPFSQEIVQHLMKQIISAFVYLHSCHIIHRDVKLENFLVQFPKEEDKENLNMMKAKIKITDFGLSKYLKGQKMATTILGNPQNMDPYIFKKMLKINDDNNFGYGLKADIWSLGTCTYELLIGCPAFDASSYEELFQKVENGDYRIPSEINISVEAIAFLSGMLQYNPESRLDINSLSKQYFLTRNVSTFHNMNLKRNEDDLGNSMIFNAKKEESSNVEEIMKIYGFEDEIDLNKTQDDKPYDKFKTGKKICEDEEDFVGNIIENGEKIPQTNENEQIKDNKVDDNMNKYLNELFDEMNKNCFCFEPLLIPIQPIDNNYNISYNDSSDPISKFMEDL